MKVNSIEIIKFMSHAKTAIELPDRGVVVLMGENGAGKSAFVEAVSMAHFGRTLRGTTPWRTGEAGQLIVDSSLVGVTRKVTKSGSKKLQWCPAGETTYRKYDTPTKAEAELAATVGDFDTWRRTHVFSSSDATDFSSSSDGKRKRFIEQIIGLERFDIALDRCRVDITEARYNCSGAKGTVTALTTLRNEAQQSLVALIEPATHVPDAPEPIAEPEGGRGRMLEHAAAGVAAEDALKALAAEPTDVVDPAIQTRLNDAHHDDIAADRVLRLAQSGRCGVCSQRYDLVEEEEAERASGRADDRLNAAKEAFNTEESRVAQASITRKKRAGELQAEATRFRAAWDTMSRAFDRHEMRAREIVRHVATCRQAATIYAQQLAAHRKRKFELDGKIFEYDDQIDAEQATADELEPVIAELEACEKVLGLGGVRVPVLGHALQAAEFFANGGLAGLGRPGLKIRLRPYRQLADGRTNSDIGFEVEGAGGGHGYDAASGGERRRIDACLLLAFAEVRAANSVCGDGTLWIDEMFDAIDESGCAAAANMLADIGTRRCVVVITHREDLARQLDAVARYRVVDGVLETI